MNGTVSIERVLEVLPDHFTACRPKGVSTTVLTGVIKETKGFRDKAMFKKWIESSLPVAIPDLLRPPLIKGEKINAKSDLTGRRVELTFPLTECLVDHVREYSNAFVAFRKVHHHQVAPRTPPRGGTQQIAEDVITGPSGLEVPPPPPPPLQDPRKRKLHTVQQPQGFPAPQHPPYPNYAANYPTQYQFPPQFMHYYNPQFPMPPYPGAQANRLPKVPARKARKAIRVISNNGNLNTDDIQQKDVEEATDEATDEEREGEKENEDEWYSPKRQRMETKGSAAGPGTRSV